MRPSALAWGTDVRRPPVRPGSAAAERIIAKSHRMNSSGLTELVPLRTDADGVIRVGGTRVTLDTIVGAFEGGATAEEIAQRYPSVALADVYSVIAYYLRHDEQIRSYLDERARRAAETRVQNDRHFDPSGVRDRLLARRR